MKKKDGSIMFLLIGHETIGEPGANGRIKITMRMSFSGEIFTVHTHLLVALKIIRNDRMEVPGEPILTECARDFYSDIYNDVYGFANRETKSKKSRYRGHEAEHVDEMTRELACDRKIYISIPLFNALDLFYYFKENHTTLSDSTFFSILLGVLDEIEKLHARGVVHRDIKFENILINPETLCIDLIDHDACAPIGAVVKMYGTTNYMKTDFLESCKANGNMEKVSPYRDLYAFAMMVNIYLDKYHLKSIMFENILRNMLSRIYGADSQIDLAKIKTYLIENFKAKSVGRIIGSPSFGLKEKIIVISLKSEAENTPPNTPERT
jgi:serine/threonine protein kinase